MEKKQLDQQKTEKQILMSGKIPPDRKFLEKKSMNRDSRSKKRRRREKKKIGSKKGS